MKQPCKKNSSPEKNPVMNMKTALNFCICIILILQASNIKAIILIEGNPANLWIILPNHSNPGISCICKGC